MLSLFLEQYCDDTVIVMALGARFLTNNSEI